MFCTRCGSANPEDVQFCHNCGAQLIRSSAPLNEPSSPPEYNLPRFSQPTQFGYQPSYTNERVEGNASTRAIASMILSLISIATCGPLLSVPGLILGKLELDAIRNGQAPAAGETFAKIGYYAGIVITILSCLGGLAYLMFIISVAGAVY